MKQLYVKETYVQDDSITHITDPIETDVKSLAELYKRIRQNLGGKITKMYIDDDNGNAKQVGYVVDHLATDERTGEKYKETIWIELLKPIKVMREVTQYESI